MPRPPEPEVAPWHQTIAGFQIVRELGRGGMGVVLLAQDGELNRLVAIKLLRADDPRTLARFRLEANALAGLAHPNAVRIFRFGEDAGRFYLAMEYVEGQSLDRVLREGPMDPRRAARLMALVALAVHAAHLSGIIHRDLKPANVLLDGDDNPKITDFGIAKRLDAPGQTETNVVIGTPAYMAPDQAVSGRDADIRTDVYGLGATLYECLTGRPPFVGPALHVLRQVAEEDPVPPRRLNRAIPQDLETVCLKCLAREPGKRYPAAADLAADLERFLRGEPVVARPVTWPERAWRWCRRNKLVAGLAGVAVTSLVAGAVVATVLAYTAIAARDLAKDAEAAALIDKQLAIEKADETAAINSFLDDLLRQASGQVQARAGYRPNPNLTVCEALDRAAEHAGSRFRDKPATEESVRITLGEAYQGIGVYHQSAKQFRHAFDSRTKRLGQRHRDTLALLSRLGRAERQAGRLDEAVRLSEDCLRLCREQFEPTDRATLGAMDDLVMAYQAVTRQVKAEPLAEESLRLHRATLGPTDPSTLLAMRRLGEIYFSLGKNSRAIPLAEEGMRLCRKTLGPAHHETLRFTLIVADAMRAEKREAEVIQLCQDALPLALKSLDADDPLALEALNNLAAVVRKAKKDSAATALREKNLQQHSQTLGPNHPETLRAMSELARYQFWDHRMAEAISLWERCLELQRQHLRSDHPDALDTRMHLAMAYREAKRRPEAATLLEEVLANSKDEAGQRHPRTIAAARNLAVVYRELRRSPEALPLYHFLLQTLPNDTKAKSSMRLTVMGDLAATHEEMNEWSKALPLREAVWKVESAHVPPSPQASQARFALGVALLRLNRHTEAEQHLLAHHDDFIKLKGMPSGQLRACRRRLGELYDKWGKKDEADRWLALACEEKILPMPRVAPPD